jgi:DHA1 family bicyclomycin/chloramphenicol resistance-like MFS transporter
MIQKHNVKMSRGEFIAFSACSMALTALGIDIMLPVFENVRDHFNLEPGSPATALIIVFFFMGQTAQIIFGTLSDRFGRIAILRVGFLLYIVGGVIATYSPTLQMMFAFRFVAGVGASAVFMTTIAGVRDRFVGDEMARTMSLIFTIFLLTPVFAPFLGLAILSVSSWKMVFLTPPLFAVLVFFWSTRLDESWSVEQRIEWNWDQISKSIREVLGNKIFLRYTTVTTLLFSGLSTYVANSERIVSEIYKKPSLFAWIFAAIGLLMCISTLINSRMSEKFGARKAIRALLIIYTVIAGLLVVITLYQGDPPSIIIFFVCIGFLMATNLSIEPNSSSLALESLGSNAGTASAVYGTCFFLIGSIIGLVVSYFLSTGLLVMIVAYFVIGALSLILVYGDKRSMVR